MGRKIYRWVIACRAGWDKPWHIRFAGKVFISWEAAAKQALDFNDGTHGYQHKPVMVELVLEEDLNA